MEEASFFGDEEVNQKATYFSNVVVMACGVFVKKYFSVVAYEGLYGRYCGWVKYVGPVDVGRCF